MKSQHKIFPIISILIMILTIVYVPSVNAYTITLSNLKIEPYYNYSMALSYLPYVDNDNISIVEPKYIYYAIYSGENTDDFKNYTVIFYMFFWEKQEFYIFSHPCDYEPYIVLINNENNTIENIAFDRWHYLVGRVSNPIVINDYLEINKGNVSYNITTNSVPVNLNIHYRSFKYDEDFIYNRTQFISFVNNTEIRNLTSEIILNASQSVGFDSKIYENPFLVFEKGLVFYKVISFWNSLTKAIITMSDERFKALDFSDRDNTWTKFFEPKNETNNGTQ